MTSNPLPGYDDWKTTPPDFFEDESDDGPDPDEKREQRQDRA